jgi:hypothetical protein
MKLWQQKHCRRLAHAGAKHNRTKHTREARRIHIREWNAHNGGPSGPDASFIRSLFMRPVHGAYLR